MKTIQYKICLIILGFALLVGCAGPAASPDNNQPAAPTSQPSNNPSVSAVKLPKGLFVDTHDNNGITYFNIQGQSITELNTPNLPAPNNELEHVVIAGSIAPGANQVPVVYWTNNPDPALMLNKNNQVSVLLKANNIAETAGAPGQAILAYSTADSQNNSFLNKLYVGTLDTIPTAKAVISLQAIDCFCTLTPLTVEAVNNTVKGVWYTMSPTGLGGVGFYPNNGLYFYDYSSGETKQYLDSKQNFRSLSLDHSLAAIMDNSDRANQKFKVVDLNTNTSFNLALDAGSTNGGGAVQFSPDNRFMAWEESSGTTMSDTPDYHSRVRVAQLGDTPGLVRDLTDSTVTKALGISEVMDVIPVGWLDNQTLLVQVNGYDQLGTVAKLDMASGTISNFIKGSFIAFAYE